MAYHTKCIFFHPFIYIYIFSFCLHFRCDADPSALAKYVVALVKKDKSEKELKALCNDQLDVFLQKGTLLSYTFQFNRFTKALHAAYFVEFLKMFMLADWHSGFIAETQTFVDKLFEALNSKSYLPQPVPEQPAPTSRPADSHQRPDKDEPRKEEVSSPCWKRKCAQCVAQWKGLKDTSRWS